MRLNPQCCFPKLRTEKGAYRLYTFISCQRATPKPGKKQKGILNRRTERTCHERQSVQQKGQGNLTRGKAQERRSAKASREQAKVSKKGGNQLCSQALSPVFLPLLVFRCTPKTRPHNSLSTHSLSLRERREDVRRRFSRLLVVRR